MAVIGTIAAYLLQKPHSESFADMPAPISEQTDDDPRDLPWIASWSPADRYARKGQICDILTEEQGPHGTTIYTVKESCEAGMAHTRPGDRIILPDTIPFAFRQDTITHEMYHIWQRRRPDLWRSFYTQQWGFEFADGPPSDMPPSVVTARRSNPDTWDSPWVRWQRRYWPVCVYRDPSTPALRDATVVWWDDSDRTLLTAPPASWIAFFGRPAQEEHPHELAAVLLTDRNTSCEAGRRVVAWWDGVAAPRLIQGGEQ